ncbi:MAG: glycosyltransferase family 4 protein [Chthoniobacterales bacterium]
MPHRLRLAIITTHPVQYYAPWFRYLSENTPLTLKVFYLWDFGISTREDPAFKKSFQWDIPLLDGYESELVPNKSADPGTHHFKGIDNPELSARISEWKPDAVLLIGYNYSTLLHFIKTWNRHAVPMIFRGDSHRIAETTSVLRRAVKQIALRLLYARFAAFLPVGTANAAYFRSYGVPARKLFLAPHAVENSRFEEAANKTDIAKLRAEWQIPADTTIFLFVGKLESKKRPMDLLEAFAQSSSPNTALVFAGSGELEDSLRQRASQISEPVRFLGFKNQSEMPAVYACSDVLVLPSYGSYETWGLAVNEAMACGKPAIVSSHVGCAEDLILPGKTGWRFEAGDVAALRACIEDAATNRTRVVEMSRHAQEFITSHNSYQTASQGLLRALESIYPS